jgi:hypothetical protein
MTRTTSLEQALALIRTGLEDRLGKFSYQVAIDKDEYPLLGSYVMIWSNDGGMLRLPWDGNENVFYIDTSNDPPLRSESAWRTVSTTAFDALVKAVQYIFLIAEKVINSLS